jgi:copper(I)-binding protein
MANGVMEMRAMPEGLPVPARGEVSLAPGGTHVMLDGAGPLVAGERFNLVLQFEKSGDVTVPVSVVAPGAR